MGPGNAIVLLSGGLDSATALAWAQDVGYKCMALSFDYGQRHRTELQAAAAVAAAAGVEHHIITMHPWGGSALNDLAIDVPKNRDEDTMAASIPPTYVPARNTLFFAFALAVAEATDADAIVGGMNARDYSGYPDCRPAFIAAFQALVNVATRSGIEDRRPHILAPLIYMSKADIIALGTRLGVNYGLTHSCYAPDDLGRPCGECDSCLIRASGFAAVNQIDPALIAR